MKDEPVDHPWAETITKANVWILKGATVFFKFTCEKCGARQTFEEANSVWKEGTCEECGHVTNLVKNGCGFLALFERPDPEVERFLQGL